MIDNLEEAIEKITEIYLKEFWRKSDKRYIISKTDLIKFCLDLLKYVQKQEE